MLLFGHAQRTASDREGDGQLGMVGGAVVALARVLHHELPVGLLDQRRLKGDFPQMQLVRRQHRLELVVEVVERGRRLRQAHVDGAGDGAQRHRAQVVLGRVEVGRHAGRVDQLALQVVGPLMVRAHEAGALRQPVRADLRAAVPAGIEERPQRVVPAAHHHDRRAADGQRQGAARRWQFRLETDQGPRAVMDRIDVEGEYLRVGVELLRQRMARSPPVEQGADAGEIGHAAPRVVGFSECIRILPDSSLCCSSLFRMAQSVFVRCGARGLPG